MYLCMSTRMQYGQSPSPPTTRQLFHTKGALSRLGTLASCVAFSLPFIGGCVYLFLGYIHWWLRYFLHFNRVCASTNCSVALKVSYLPRSLLWTPPAWLLGPNSPGLCEDPIASHGACDFLENTSLKLRVTNSRFEPKGALAQLVYTGCKHVRFKRKGRRPNLHRLRLPDTGREVPHAVLAKERACIIITCVSRAL